MTTVRATAAHLAPVFIDIDATIDKAVGWIDNAGARRDRTAGVPEVFVPGYPYWIECYPPLDQVRGNRKYQEASIEVPGPEIAGCRLPRGERA